MANFFAELKRRNIYRVGAAYAVVTWVLIQLVSNVSPMLRLPEWAGTFVLVLLLVGFPVALLFAWVQQLAPTEGALGRATTGKLDWALMGALVVVIALMSYQQLAPTGDRSAQVQQQASVAAARDASLSPAGAVSIAVLPFDNISGDASQEFFSTGMTEEITAALAKIPNLRVVARTSAFQFKAQNRDVLSIGQVLHATHYVEGSVRKDGNRLRITAQLIKSDVGTHMWSENYDREFTDVFAIQEDIATSIAGALTMPLGLKPGESLVLGTRNLSTYQAYLQAKAWYRDRASNQVGPYRETLESVVARDPGFAPAWAVLSLVYAFQMRPPSRRAGQWKRRAALWSLFGQKPRTPRERRSNWTRGTPPAIRRWRTSNIWGATGRRGRTLSSKG